MGHAYEAQEVFHPFVDEHDSDPLNFFAADHNIVGDKKKFWALNTVAILNISIKW